MVISSSTHKSCYIVHSDFIIQFLLIYINSIRNLFMPKERDAIDPTQNQPSLSPQRKNQSRAEVALLPAPGEDP